jgi:hypothetical protein
MSVVGVGVGSGAADDLDAAEGTELTGGVAVVGAEAP